MRRGGKIAVFVTALVFSLATAGSAAAECQQVRGPDQVEQVPAVTGTREVPFSTQVTEMVPEVVTVPGPIVDQWVQVQSGEWRTVMVPEARQGTRRVWKLVPVPKVDVIYVRVPGPPEIGKEIHIHETVETIYKDKAVEVTKCCNTVFDHWYEWTETETRTEVIEVPEYRFTYYHDLFYQRNNGTKFTKSCSSSTPIYTCDRISSGATYLGHDSYKVKTLVGTTKFTITKEVEVKKRKPIYRQEPYKATIIVKEPVETIVRTPHEHVTQIPTWTLERREIKYTVWEYQWVDVPYTYYVDVPTQQWVTFWTWAYQPVQTYISTPTGNMIEQTRTVWSTRTEDYVISEAFTRTVQTWVLSGCEVNPA